MKIYIKKWMIALVLLLLGIICVAFAVNSIYFPATEECDQLEKNIQTWKNKLKEAQDNLNQKPYYESETKKLVAQTQELLDSLHFPGEIKEEDQILYIQKVEEDTKQPQTQIVFGADSSMLSSGSLELHEKTFPFSYVTTYEGLKDLIKYFAENEENPSSLVSLSIKYDAASDTCTGDMLIRRYYLTGVNPYIPPEIPGVEIGTDIIFG